MDSSTKASLSPSAENPFVAQREFARGKAFVVADDKAVLVVSGPDRLVWLNSLISQEVLGLVPGMTKESLLLDPQGRIEHAFFITDDGDSSWLLTDRSHADALESWLRTMVFRMDVGITRPAENAVVVCSQGTGHLAKDDKTALVSWRDPWPTVSEGSIGYREGAHPAEGLALTYELFDEMPAALLETGKVPSDALDAVLVASARPTLADTDEKSLPHEYDWLRTSVHLNKGCYRGQETVAKVHNLGHPPRRFTLIHLDGSSSLLPGAGDTVLSAETPVGTVTRAVRHFELGPIALALVKRTTDPDLELEVVTSEGSVAATQELLVPVDAGATRAIPRLPRL